MWFKAIPDLNVAVNRLAELIDRDPIHITRGKPSLPGRDEDVHFMTERDEPLRYRAHVPGSPDRSRHGLIDGGVDDAHIGFEIAEVAEMRSSQRRNGEPETKRRYRDG